MTNLNFLPRRQVVLDSDRGNQKKLLAISFACLVLVGLLTAGISIYKKNLEDKRDRLLAQKASFRDEIKRQEKELAVLQALHYKVTGIKYILGSQFKYSQAISSFFSLLPPGTTLQSFSIDKAGIVNTQLTASDAGALKRLTATLTDSKNNFKDVQLGTVDVKGDKPFGLNLDFKITISKNEEK